MPPIVSSTSTDIYLMLGRNGDVTNLLPVLKQYSLDHNRPARLCVCHEFAPLLDGVSYVEPIVWNSTFDQVAEAKAWIYKKFPGHGLIDCSVYGSGVNGNFEMRSFNREIWKKSKTTLLFERAELVFDRRSPEREQALLSRFDFSRPVVLYSGAGWSSPFRDTAQFYDALCKLMPGYNVINLSDVRSERPYDLLALYEKAVGLVTTDSFPLHLAQAVPTMKTVALLCDRQRSFFRSAWKPYQVLRCLYSEALVKRIGEIVRAVTTGSLPELLFVTNYGPVGEAANAARIARAKRSRAEEFRNGPWREIDFNSPRDGSSIGDRPVPYVRDLLDAAAAEAKSDGSVLVISNDDIGFCAGLTGLIIETVQRHGAAYAHRWDYNHPLTKRLPKDEYDILRAQWYCGCDLFAMTKGWWVKHREMFPDMLMGREWWDCAMRNLIRRNGHPIETELMQAIWHERHDSYWLVHRGTAPGNLVNGKLMKEWLERYGGSESDWQTSHPTYK
jgi:hypothetical protein